MTKETLETTNKLIIPNRWKDDKSQEILESLEWISDEEIMEAWEEFEKAKKESYDQEQWNDQQKPKEQEDSTSEITTFENIWTVWWDCVEYDESNLIVRWRGKSYKIDTFEKVNELITDLLDTKDHSWFLQVMGELWI